MKTLRYLLIPVLLFLAFILLGATQAMAQGDARIQVFIGPEDARTAGAQWRVVGLDNWNDSGVTEDVAPNSQFDIEFQRIIGWIKPANVTVRTRSTDQEANPTTTLTVYYNAGQLTVTIEPEQARVDGAGWRLAGTLPDTDDGWYPSGTTVTGVEPGEDEIIEFKPVSGWLQPSTRSVLILEGVTTFHTETYERGTLGALQVVIEPAQANADGAQWRRVGETTWLDSGFTEQGIPPGNYAIEFKSVSGWIRPDDIQNVPIVAAQTEFRSGTYTRSNLGALHVLIEPAGARSAGAQWRRVGTTTWFDSGFTEEGIFPDDYDVEFKPISGWDPPANVNITIDAAQTAYTAGTYTALGALHVLIEPDGARDAGAQWRRVGTTTWFDSGFTEEGIPTGDHDIEFKAVSGWIRPGNENVDITAGQTSFITGTYIIARTGFLIVVIDPDTALAEGAQWRRVGAAAWRASNQKEQVFAGPHQVEFRKIPGWIAPNNQSVNVQPDQNSYLYRKYQKDEPKKVHLPGVLMLLLDE